MSNGFTDKLDKFQNILCYCLTRVLYRCRCRMWKISKHPMLLFNFSGDGRAGIFTDISKHPMLLFNRSFDSKTYQTFLFQNILCYCLTSIGFGKVAKGISFQNILCYCLTRTQKKFSMMGKISKHPMLLFNSFISL